MPRPSLGRAALSGLLLAALSGGVFAAARSEESCSNTNSGVSVVQACDISVDAGIVNTGTRELAGSDEGGDGSGSNSNSGISVVQLSGTDVGLSAVNTGTQSEGGEPPSGSGSGSAGGGGGGGGGNTNSGISVVQLSDTHVDLSVLNTGTLGSAPGGEEPGPGPGYLPDELPTPPGGGGPITPPGNGGGTTTPPGGGGGTTPPGGGTTTPNGSGTPGSPADTTVLGAALTRGTTPASGGAATPTLNALPRTGDPAVAAAGAAPEEAVAPAVLPSGLGGPLSRTGFPAGAATAVGVLLVTAGGALAAAGRRPARRAS